MTFMPPHAPTSYSWHDYGVWCWRPGFHTARMVELAHDTGQKSEVGKRENLPFGSLTGTSTFCVDLSMISCPVASLFILVMRISSILIFCSFTSLAWAETTTDLKQALAALKHGLQVVL